MTRCYLNTTVDLFGDAPVISGDSIEAGLMRRDDATIQQRALRWEFLEELRQGNEVHYMGRLEGGYLFRESESTFVDGYFAATILLVQAVIEWMLQGWLIEHGYIEESRKGIGQILRFLRRNELLPPFILGEIDKLRRKRNHFAHFKIDDDEMQLDRRMRSNSTFDPHSLMQEDAEYALRLLHQLYGTRFRKIEIRKTSTS